jgi:hypothetical protein
MMPANTPIPARTRRNTETKRASKKTSARAFRAQKDTNKARRTVSARKARPAKAAAPIAIVDTTPTAAAIKTVTKVSAYEMELRHSMAADFQQQMEAAGFPVSEAFALEIWTEPASMIAAVGTKIGALGTKMESLRRRLGVVRVRLMDAPESTPTDALALLIEERRAVAECVDITTADEAVRDALAEHGAELDRKIARTPAANGRELAAKMGIALEMIADGDSGQHVVALLEAIRGDALSLPGPLSADCFQFAG